MHLNFLEMAEFGQFLINNMRSSLEPEDLRILNRNSAFGYRMSTKSDNCCSPIKEEDNDLENNNYHTNDQDKKLPTEKKTTKPLELKENTPENAEKTRQIAEALVKKLDLNNIQANEALNGSKKPMYIENFQKVNKKPDEQVGGTNFGVRSIKWGSYVESWKNLAEKYNQSTNRLSSPGTIKTHEEKQKPNKVADPSSKFKVEGRRPPLEIRPDSRLVAKALNCKLNVKSSVYKSKRYKPTRSMTESTDELSSNSQKVTNNPIYIPESKIR